MSGIPPPCYECVLRTFHPRELRAPPAYFILLQKSTFQPLKLWASAVYYVCATKVDFPATEAPDIRGVLHLYYKSTLEAPGASMAYYVCTTKKSSFQPLKLRRPRRTTFVLQKSTFPATVAPGVPGVLHLYYKSQLSSHGSPRRTTSVLQKSKKRKNTTVLVPRPRENPQRDKKTVLAPRLRRNPQRVAIPIGDVNPPRRLRKNNFY